MLDADDNFYSRADEHINLSNSQITDEYGKGEVSASFMYSDIAALMSLLRIKRPLLIIL